MKNIRLKALLGCFLLMTACSLPFNLLSSSEATPQAKEKSFNIGEILHIQPAETPTPIPLPTSRLEEANYAFFAGDLDTAQQLYQLAYDQAVDNDLKANALLGLGKTFYSRRDYTSAIDAFNRLLGQFPNTDASANAYFFIGESYFDIEEFLQAANAYAKYAEHKPGVIDNLARTYQGNAALAGSDYQQAIIAYQAALQSDPPGIASYLNIQIGKAYDNLGDYTTAIHYYMTVYDTAQENSSKATANLLAGQAYQKLGLNDEAYTRFMDSVIQFPKEFDSFTALSILVSNGVPVNDFYRGLVDYYAGSYDAAIQAFQRYIESNPDNNDGSVHYFKGLSHYKNDEPREAVAEYETLIANYPGNSYWSAAWDEKAFVQAYVLDEFSNAAETYKRFVSVTPSSADAPTYLFEAGRVYERAGNLEEAAATWQRMMDEYPSAELSYRGLFLAGISYYRLGRYEEAHSIFQRSLVLGTSPAEKAKAYLWLGKTFTTLGKPEDAKNAWLLAEAADPTDYYSIRAGELLKGLEPFTIEEGIDLGYDLEFEKPEADSWLRTTFYLPAETDLNGLGELANNQRIKRISAFYDLGLFKEAINEAELLRAELQADVVNSYRLMNFLVEKNLYQPAIYTCRNILSHAGMDDLSSLTAPIYFTHIRFGAYFREMLTLIANDYEIPPLLLYALIRQESMFNPFISSSVGASGLSQIMPATGAENVALLKWPANYDSRDLLLGKVNVTIGAFYLDRMRTYLSGGVQAALAAYNAGPGNAESWLALSNGDPDLFLEVIRAQETQDYLMQITEFLNVYKLVYSRPQ
ncbi:MAG: tetratricopeptide repeat protein [Pelolinea sp.]|nr:tetratricopeptide repeat protein [Pelolinea sp.]